MTAKLIIDAFPISLSLEENEQGKFVARGEFGRCDLPTQNGRMYPRKVYEREIKKLQETIDRRRMFGELDHPADGKTKLQRVSHIITGLSLEEDGRVMGEAEILDTPQGKTLKAILTAGAEAGVSSRGFGSTSPSKDGSQVVGEDFVLKTFDFVADPAMKTAYPEIYTEDLDDEMDAISFEESFPHIVEEIKGRERENAERAVSELLQRREDDIKADLEDRYAQNLSKTLNGLRESVVEDVRNELNEDPSVGGSRALLTKIAEMVSDFNHDTNRDIVAYKDALSVKEEELEELESQKSHVEGLLKETGYLLKLEQMIGGHPKAGNIRKLIGDPSRFESMNELSDRLRELIEGYDEFSVEEEISFKAKYNANVEELRSEFDSLRDSYESQVEGLKAEINELTEANETLYLESQSNKDLVLKSTRLAEEWEEKAKSAKHIAESAQRHASRKDKTSGFANSSELMRLVEGIDDDRDVDEVIKTRGSHTMSDPSLEGVRQKVKRGASRYEPKDLSEMTDELPLAEFNERLFDGLTPNKLKLLSGL